VRQPQFKNPQLLSRQAERSRCVPRKTEPSGEHTSESERLSRTKEVSVTEKTFAPSWYNVEAVHVSICLSGGQSFFTEARQPMLDFSLSSHRKLDDIN
jgi:hypothetical protein